MKIFIRGKSYNIDEDESYEKWKMILDTIGFYNEEVKKFASLYCEIHNIKQKENLINPKNLLAINLMVLSKIDIDDDKTIQYSEDESIIKDYINPIIIESDENDFSSSSNDVLDMVTDSISDVINNRMNFYSNLYVEDIISDIETTVVDKTLNIRVFSKFGTD